MQKVILMGLLALVCTPLVPYSYGQANNKVVIGAGYLDPKGAKGSMLVGFIFQRGVDEAVDVGIGVDLFHKKYSEESEVAQENLQGLTTKTYTTSVDYSRTIIPVTLNLDVKIRITSNLGYLIHGGISYQFLISKEKNYELNSTQTRNFGGLGWQGSGGIYYKVGARSRLLLNAFYNSCEVSREVKESQLGLPVSERVDLSGLGFKIGVALDLR